jgi:predicted nuclease with RNAse H fold
MDSDFFGSCRAVQKHPLTTTPPITGVGIDVGGVRKGFHAVALRDGVYAGQLGTGDVQELADWCRSVVGASVIAIDAPCRWSSDGRARPCERELMRQGICCFETFPHAITWHLRNGEAKARQKRPQRTALLAQAGITTAPLTSIDWIDAALCALAAHRVASGAACRAYGEPESGLIVVPERPGAPDETGLDRPNLSV